MEIMNEELKKEQDEFEKMDMKIYSKIVKLVEYYEMSDNFFKHFYLNREFRWEYKKTYSDIWNSIDFLWDLEDEFYRNKLRQMLPTVPCYDYNSFRIGVNEVLRRKAYLVERKIERVYPELQQPL